MPFDFDQVIDRTGTQSLKWDAYADRDVIPMWVADMDFEAPPCVVDALQERVAHRVFGYTLASGELTDVLLARFRDLYAWPIEPEWLVWLPGVVPGLLAACRTFSAPGDEIVTFTPIYPPFLAAPEQSGRILKTVPLMRRGGRYTIDIEAFESAITPRTRLLMLCHPHNPVGRVFTTDELRAVADVCRRHDIYICSDDIHCDLILDGTPHRPIGTLGEDVAGASMVLMSPGKTFNTAGLNMAFAVIPDPARRRAYKAACKGMVPDPNALALTAALAAYRDGEPWRRELLAVLRRNADHVHACVNTKLDGLRMDPVDATYLAWIDISSLDLKDPVGVCREAGLGLMAGKAFGDSGYVRLNFGCPMPLLDEGLKRLGRAIGATRGA